MDICYFPQQDILETSHMLVGLNVADADAGISEDLTWERKSFQMESMFTVFRDSEVFWHWPRHSSESIFMSVGCHTASAKCFEFQTPS